MHSYNANEDVESAYMPVSQPVCCYDILNQSPGVKHAAGSPPSPQGTIMAGDHGVILLEQHRELLYGAAC